MAARSPSARSAAALASAANAVGLDGRRLHQRELVDEDIERTEFLSRPFHQGRNPVGVTEFGSQAVNAAHGPEVPLDAARGAVDGQNLRTVLDERSRYRLTDSSPSTGHQRLHSVQPQRFGHVLSLPNR